MGIPRRLTNRSAAALLACLMAAAFAAAPAFAAAAGVSTTAHASPSRAIRFWTPARMRRARPLEVAPPRRSAGARASASPPGRVALASADGSQAPAEFATVADPAAAGFSQNGAVFVVLPHHEGLARCSGTSVEAPNLSVVFTAGHCVNSGGPRGHWYNHDWVFVPGYHDGVRPFGAFVAKWVGSTSPWIAAGSENADVGAAVVARNERGQRLAAAAGAAGIAFGLPPGQVFDVHGYPVAPPFNGATQRLCAGTPFLGHDVDSFLWRGPLNLAVTCDVTGGASGGGWTIAGNVLNGVTDYGYGDDPTTDFGSYFGGAVRALYEQAGRVK
jgi:hypothetical protein